MTSLDVQYLVLRDGEVPFLLARVRWPDIAQVATLGHPDWQDDPGLFDLPYDPCSVAVTTAEAGAIAADWGIRLPVGGAAPEYSSRLIRRMPANWSNLTAAERRALALGPNVRADRPTAGKRTGSRVLGRLRSRRAAIPAALPAVAEVGRLARMRFDADSQNESSLRP